MEIPLFGPLNTRGMLPVLFLFIFGLHDPGSQRDMCLLELFILGIDLHGPCERYGKVI